MDFANSSPGLLHVGDTIKSVIFSGIGEIEQGYNEYNPDTAYMYAYSGGKHAGYDISGPQFHPAVEGVDADYTNPIYTPLGGQVVEATPAGVRGPGSDSYRPNPIMIKTVDDPSTPVNEGGYTLVFGHLWKDAVHVGDIVKPGQFIGDSGEQTEKGTMTPDGTGPHVHFEVWNSANQFVDPAPFLNPNGQSALTTGNPGDGAVSDTSTGGSGSGSAGVNLPGLSTSLANAGTRAMLFIAGTLLVGFGLWSLGGDQISAGAASIRGRYQQPDTSMFTLFANHHKARDWASR